MSASIRDCPSCASPLPEKSKFCPTCGTATPQMIDMATGQIVIPAAAPAEEGAQHRERLQRALGKNLVIRRLLGRGGFAEVYAAFDTRLKREVAVKTLRYDLVISDTLLQRFQREAEAVAKLRHPNIIPIYEVGEGDGTAYFVMPMIEGESLAEALQREQSLSIEDTCRILREAASALAAAHRAGIVHRDIKPDNIMLEGPEQRVVVMDFGIAKATTGGAANLTGTGMAMGTPHYMSPEQASGQRDLDARSDQYALAMVGYRMLAGRLPFEADTMSSLIIKQIAEVPKPVRELRQDVPPELSDALVKALAKEPAARYQSMEEFAAAIPAIGVLGPAASAAAAKRRRPSIADLSRFRGAIMPRWQEPLLLLGALGLVLGIALFRFSTQKSAIAVAAKHDEAMFAARTFLTGQGATGSFDEKMNFQGSDTTYAWLQRSLGAAAAEQRAATDIPQWQWHLHWERSNASSADEKWAAGLGPGGRVVHYLYSIPDTASGATITRDSALVLTHAFLGKTGVDPARLTQVKDSVVRRAKRSDHYFSFDARDAALVGQRGDTAVPRANVTVAGDRIATYNYRLKLPDSYVTELRAREKRRTPFMIGVFVIWFALCVGAIAVAVARQRTDELQWKLGVRYAVAIALLLGVSVLQEAYVNPEAEALPVLILGTVFLGFFMIVGVIFGVASGESLANEVNPPALLGLESLGRLRVTGPEWAPAIFRGFALAGATVGLRMLMYAFGERIGVWPRGIPDPLEVALPWLAPLSVIGASVLMALTLFLSLHFVARYTKQPWLGILLPGVIVALFGLESSFASIPIAIVRGVTISAVTWGIWRYGFLTGVIALFAAEVFEYGAMSFALPGGQYMLSALVCLALFVGLPAFAVLSRRRLAT